jgi:uncharacterized phage protein gp47/JayE
MPQLALKALLSVLAPLASQAFFHFIVKLVIKWAVNAIDAAVIKAQKEAAKTDSPQDDVMWAAIKEAVDHIKQALMATEKKED